MSNLDQVVSRQAERRASIPPVAYLLTACVAVVGCNSLVLGPIAPDLATDFGTSVPAIMMAASAFGLGTAGSALLLARHIDRVGARKMLQRAMLLLAAALVLSAVAPAAGVLVAAQLLAGIAAGIALPATYGSAAMVAPPGRESAVIGVVLVGWTLSMVAGVSLSAVVADFLHWRVVFAAVAALALAALVGISGASFRDEPKPGPSPSPLAALSTPGIVPLLIACFAFMTGFYGVYGYLGDHLHRELGRPLSANGMIALSYGIGFGSAAFLDPLVDRIGARRVMPVAYLAVAAIFGLMATASASFVAIVLLVALWGLANHFGLNVLVMRLTVLDPARRGTIMGLNSAVTYFAVFVGTTGFGPVYAGYGFAAACVAAVALTLTAALAGAIPPAKGSES